MNAKQIKGLPVIGVAEDATLGTVDDVYVDVEARALLGFAVGGGASLAGLESAYLDPSDIRSIGADAVMVDNREAMRGEEVRTQIGALVNIDSLMKRNVMTEGGVNVGTVADVAFDPPDYAFTHIEVSPGLFKTNAMIPIAQVVSIGPEQIIVSNAVGAEKTPDDAEATAAAEPEAQSTPARAG